MSIAGYKPAPERAFVAALDHLDTLDRRSVSATATREELRSRLCVPLPDDGTPAEDVIADLVEQVRGGILGSAGGRFFGWVIGGAVPAALAADWLTAAWDQNGMLYATSPAAAIVEEACGMWLKELLALPEGASFALTTGCQMAHITCLAAARHALLAGHGVNVDAAGLFGAPPVAVLTSTERHGSVERAVRLLGIGRSNLVHLGTDDRGRLVAGALETALEERRGAPTIVILQAGDLNIGAFDDFATLIPIAHHHRAWVHVDGAFGLWAAACPSRRWLMTGAQSADSWATDGHKWLNVPFDCGYAFVADPAAHSATLTHRAGYLSHDGVTRDQIDWTPDWSRRARGFATYAALRQLGARGVAVLVDRCCDHARTLVRAIGALPHAEIIWESAINQGLVRFLRPGTGSCDADHDAMTDAVIASILQEGDAFFTGTTWRGRRAMRISVCNWQTSDSDVERAIRAVQRAIEGQSTFAFAGSNPSRST